MSNYETMIPSTLKVGDTIKYKINFGWSDSEVDTARISVLEPTKTARGKDGLGQQDQVDWNLVRQNKCMIMLNGSGVNSWIYSEQIIGKIPNPREVV